MSTKIEIEILDEENYYIEVLVDNIIQLLDKNIVQFHMYITEDGKQSWGYGKSK